MLLIYQTDMHDLRLIHTDLKPENILLVSSEFVTLPVSKVYISLWLENHILMGMNFVTLNKVFGWYRRYQMKQISGACQSQV